MNREIGVQIPTCAKLCFEVSVPLVLLANSALSTLTYTSVVYMVLISKSIVKRFFSAPLHIGSNAESSSGRERNWTRRSFVEYGVLVYRHFVYIYFVYYDFPCLNRSWIDETNTISTEPGLMQGILPSWKWN